MVLVAVLRLGCQQCPSRPHRASRHAEGQREHDGPAPAARLPACHPPATQGAVNISVVAGVLSAERAKAMSSRGRAGIDPAGGQPYSAAAMSLVYHSAHPFIPTLRADVRLFEASGASLGGGGIGCVACCAHSGSRLPAVGVVS